MHCLIYIQNAVVVVRISYWLDLILDLENWISWKFVLIQGKAIYILANVEIFPFQKRHNILSLSHRGKQVTTTIACEKEIYQGRFVVNKVIPREIKARKLFTLRLKKLSEGLESFLKILSINIILIRRESLFNSFLSDKQQQITWMIQLHKEPLLWTVFS